MRCDVAGSDRARINIKTAEIQIRRQHNVAVIIRLHVVMIGNDQINASFTGNPGRFYRGHATID